MVSQAYLTLSFGKVCLDWLVRAHVIMLASRVRSLFISISLSFFCIQGGVHTDRQADTDIDTDTRTHTHTHRCTERERERERERESERERERHRHRCRHTHARARTHSHIHTVTICTPRAHTHFTAGTHFVKSRGTDTSSFLMMLFTVE